jgi:hypothetical protein
MHGCTRTRTPIGAVGHSRRQTAAATIERVAAAAAVHTAKQTPCRARAAALSAPWDTPSYNHAARRKGESHSE